MGAPRFEPRIEALAAAGLAVLALGGAGWLGWMIGWPATFDTGNPDFVNPVSLMIAGLLGSSGWFAAKAIRHERRHRAFGTATLELDRPEHCAWGGRSRAGCACRSPSRPPAPSGWPDLSRRPRVRGERAPQDRGFPGLDGRKNPAARHRRGSRPALPLRPARLGRPRPGARRHPARRRPPPPRDRPYPRHAAGRGRQHAAAGAHLEAGGHRPHRRRGLPGRGRDRGGRGPAAPGPAALTPALARRK